MYRHLSEIWLPSPPEDVFRFFSEARNLEVLTPPWLRFEVLTPEPIEMREGARIDYRLRVHHVPIRWQSEIVVWDPPRRFVDEQRRGPYRRWRHEHVFESREGGTLAIDEVTYVPRGGFLVQKLFVERDVRRIFEYRRAKLRELFGDGDG